MNNLFDAFDFFMRFTIDFLSIVILVSLVYYPKHKNKDFVFTFVLFNLLNFLICYLLGSSKIQIGFAFGLFAIFSIIRYRTIVISIKDMGYFFVCVALGLMSALANIDNNLYYLAGCNLFVILITYFMENMNFVKTENSKDIVYDNVEYIKPKYKEMLLEDLREKTGENIHRAHVFSVNYLKDTAVVRVYYFASENDNPVPSTLGDE